MILLKANIVETKDNGTALFGVALQGVLGARGRVHRSFALFTEYALGVDLVGVTSISTNESSTTTAGGTSTTTPTKSKDTETSLLVPDLSFLAQGAAFGSWPCSSPRSSPPTPLSARGEGEGKRTAARASSPFGQHVATARSAPTR
jgi:hypothetical protein